MPAAIDTQVKKQVINQWLSGDSRDRIAADNDIGAGTVSNIINEWKKGVEDSEYDSLRELAVYSKKEGFGLNHIASSIGLIIMFKNWARIKTKSNRSLPIWSIHPNPKS